MEKTSSIIEAKELTQYLDKENVVVIEATGGENAKENYKKEHLKGAVFLDLETQLSAKDKNPKNGGRHPLPWVKDFAQTLTNNGVSNNDRVIIYDRMDAANAAARLWWMLKAQGQQNVQVVNGGWNAIKKENLPTNQGIENRKAKSPFKAVDWQLETVNLDEVEKASQDKNFILVDVRSPQRYNGEMEPIDDVAGHIPNAINMPFANNLNSEGLFLAPEELREMYKPILDKHPNKVIFYCGSGVTACHSLLAIDYAGLPIPKLYVGSWSEWSRNNKPVATQNK